ncbi:THO complex subunit 4A-like [Melia azedarach]|uniref:THO complex subunit 4A-like n=2 Tax=Melia azedarach TaxID=155640 RepID=A0ACC1X0B8_MELAZ|nr:THO complex subunit 4A-like [Melia azedarach]KAJ4704718.1 THO complex subunit 4A-like [Melia azedarach]
MTSALDMSLDDIIKSNKKSSSRGRGGRGSGLGPARRSFKHGANQTAPYSKPVQAPVATWQHDMFVDGAAAFPSRSARSSSIETGTKLYISNLEYGVSNEDIKDLFSEVGDLKRYFVHFDRSGRSKGTAEVVFTRRADAMAAVKKYNDVQLDGKPMKIEIIGRNIVTPAAAPPTTNGVYGNQNGVSRSRQRREGAIGRPRRGGRGGRGGHGRVRGQGGKTNFSLEDLDADLEKYHQEAKE